MAKISDSDIVRSISKSLAESPVECDLININISISLLPPDSKDRKFLTKKLRKEKVKLEVFIKVDLLKNLTPKQFTHLCGEACLDAIWELTAPNKERERESAQIPQSKKSDLTNRSAKKVSGSEILSSELLTFKSNIRIRSVDLIPSLMTKQLEYIDERTDAIRLEWASNYTENQSKIIAKTIKSRCPEALLIVSISDIRSDTDLSFLRHFSFIRNFAIGSDSVESLEGLKYLPKSLDQLELYFDEPLETSLMPISRFKNLRRLKIMGPFENLDVLECMSSLQALYILETKKFDVSLISSLPNLFSLRTWESNCFELEKLNEAKKLAFLRLGLENIEDLDFLSTIKPLQFLILDYLSCVPAMPCMSMLKKLRRIEIDKLRMIKDLEFLLSIPNLEDVLVLNMNHLAVEDFSILSKNKSIRSVWTALGSVEKDVAIKAMLKLPRVKARKQFEFKELS